MCWGIDDFDIDDGLGSDETVPEPEAEDWDPNEPDED